MRVTQHPIYGSDTRSDPSGKMIDLNSRISVIIVNFNGREFLSETIDSLSNQTIAPLEVVVVDNASSDGSPSFIRKRYPNIKLIELRENTGFAGGNNIGLGHTTGELVALLNSDATADSRWIETMADVMNRHQEAAACVGKVYFHDEPRTIEQAGAEFNQLGNYWGRGHREVDRGQYDEECEVAGVTGCAMMIRREALSGEDLFDRSIFMYGEELDLTIRLRSAGYHIIYTPDSIVHHRGMLSVRRSLKQPRLFQQFHSNRNRLKLIAKYYPFPIILRSMPLLLVGLSYWNLVFLRSGGIRLALKSIREQVTYMIRGIRERDRYIVRHSEGWTRWMTRQSFAEILRMKRRGEQIIQQSPPNESAVSTTSRTD